MNMKTKYLCTLMLLGTSYSASAALVDLTGAGYVTYGDFNSYSLPIASLQNGCYPFNNSCPLYVPGTVGQISDKIVIASGVPGAGINTSLSGVERAYETPNSSSQNFFSTVINPDPNGAGEFFGDKANTWDITLLALRNYLAGESMALFFNNNNNNGSNLQSLAAWAQFEVTDNNGNRLGIFDFTNNGGAYDLISQGGGGQFLGDPTAYTSTGAGPLIGNNSSTDYVLAGGPICLDTTSAAVPIPVPCDSPLKDFGPVNHNLGSNAAAYAVVAPELNALLKNLFTLDDALLANYTMHVDLRLGCDPQFGAVNDEICTGATSGFGKNLNNGYEQLFIGTARFSDDRPPVDVPVPAVLFLFGTGLLIMRRFSTK